MHWDLNAFGLWFGVGLTMIVGAIQAAGWRHRLLILGLIGVGSLCIVGAVFWPLVTFWWPALASFMSGAAANPSSWVALLLFVAAIVLFSVPRSTRGQPTKDSQDESETIAALKEQVDDLERRFSKIAVPDLYKYITETTQPLTNRIELTGEALKETTRRLSENIGDIYRQIRVEAPNASTVYEAFKNLGDATESKVSRISEETKGLYETQRETQADIRSLLFFASDITTLGLRLIKSTIRRQQRGIRKRGSF
jgi:hypothetical protein